MCFEHNIVSDEQVASAQPGTLRILLKINLADYLWWSTWTEVAEGQPGPMLGEGASRGTVEIHDGRRGEADVRPAHATPLQATGDVLGERCLAKLRQ